MHYCNSIDRSTTKNMIPWSFFILKTKKKKKIIVNQYDLLCVFVWRSVYSDKDVLLLIYVDVDQEN